MENTVVAYAVGLIFLLVVIVGGLWFLQKDELPKRQAYADFAQCLKDNDAAFYGAFWCPACAQQKALFDGAEKKLPYIECSTPDRTGQTAVCEEKGVRSYPTWEFADGRRACGIISAEVLAYLSGCPMPSGESGEETVQDIYIRLVEEPMAERLRSEGKPVEEQELQLEETKEIINALMLLRHQVSLDDAEEPGPLFSAIYEVAYQCAAPETAAVEEEIAEPESAVITNDGETDEGQLEAMIQAIEAKEAGGTAGE